MLLDNFAAHNHTIPVSEHFVHAFTGPGIFTRALATYLGFEGGETAGNIFMVYKNNPSVRGAIHRRGIILRDTAAFRTQLVVNHFGSQLKNSEFVSWIRERDDILNKYR
jgi:hypothetical protein